MASEIVLASLVERVISGSMWVSAAQILTNIFGMISVFVLARLLDPVDFGLVAIASTITAILVAVTEMSLAQALIQHRAPDDSHFHTAWTLGLLRGLLLTVLLCAAARPIALFYDEPRLEAVIYVLSISVILPGLDNPRRIMLIKDLIFWQQFLLTVFGKLTSVVVSIAVAWIWHSYWALVVGQIAGQLVSTVMSYLILPFVPRLTWSRARELWGFSIWLTLAQAVRTISLRVDQLVLGHFLGPAVLGYYAMGDRLSQIPTRESTAPLRSTLFPALSQISDDMPRLRQAYQRIQSLVTYVALPAGIGFALVADPVVRLAMGETWLPAVPILQALSVVLALQTVSQLVYPLAMSRGQTRLLFHRDLQVFLFRVPVIVGGLMFWGLTGLIVARVVTDLALLLVNLLLVRRISALSLRQQLQVNVRGLVAVVVMSLCVLGLQRLLQLWLVPGTAARMIELAGCIALGALVYPAATALIWLLQGRPACNEAILLKIPAMLLRKLGMARPDRA